MPGVASRVREATWHPTQTARDRGRRLAALAGDGLGHDRDPALDPAWGDDVEVLAPAALRDDVADTHRRALARYG